MKLRFRHSGGALKTYLSGRRIFDVVIYNDKFDFLISRLDLMYDHVDFFVILDSDVSTSGSRKLNITKKQWKTLQPYLSKIRYFRINDVSKSGKKQNFELTLFNNCIKGLRDLNYLDLVLISDIRILPKFSVIELLRANFQSDTFKLSYSSLHFSPKQISGAVEELSQIGVIAFTKKALEQNSPKGLILGVSKHDVKSIQFENAIEIIPLKTRNKYRENSKFVSSLKILISCIKRYALIAKLNLIFKFFVAVVWERPVIVCPYVHDEDKSAVIHNFRLNIFSKLFLKFFFWQDKNLIGPERAYEYCWTKFPDKNVIILHTDMQPMPYDFFNFWYFKLIYYSLRLDNAGIVAANLLYPKKSKAQDVWFVQSGGGGFDNGKTTFIGGGGIDNAGTLYTKVLKKIRDVEWVTFGGILVQRRLLQTCGSFDSIYKWAFVMDVDYSLNARLAGFNLYQVPVNLIHEESKTTSRFMKQDNVYADFYTENHTKFDKKWRNVLESWYDFEKYL